MALGTPIVTTPAGGNIEIIKDHQNGLLAPYNDSVVFQKALTELHASAQLADAIAQNAQEKVREFSDERMLEATASLLAQAR
jgi:glycosyltransferase involved in cell wall biosynthesis